ncbi:MAG TPA: MerR family transcriptional regulator [Planctomycetota bacterium]|nr:MerR family transcriptional regulator [Planctomycetota bacterium]
MMTLEELCLEVGRELDRRGLGRQPDGRVLPAPDARTVRYYQTYGLLDRPSREGREARYGERHRLQLLAIKAFQAAGLGLAEIQRRVYGCSNLELETLLQSVERPLEAQPVVWREVTLEPGLKLMVEQSWSPGRSPADLENRVKAVLAALTAQGGTRS